MAFIVSGKLLQLFQRRSFIQGFGFLKPSRLTCILRTNRPECAISVWTQQMATQIKDLGCISDSVIVWDTSTLETPPPSFSTIGLVPITHPPPPLRLTNMLFNQTQHAVISHEGTAPSLGITALKQNISLESEVPNTHVWSITRPWNICCWCRKEKAIKWSEQTEL